MSYSWKKEDFLNHQNLERCFCVWKAYYKESKKHCYTVIEGCPICKETGLMLIEKDT